MKRTTISLLLFLEALFFGGVLSTMREASLVFFAAFWVANIFLLAYVLGRKYWTSIEWFLFGSFSVASIVGVLYSNKSLSDPVGVGITLIGLLLVAGMICATGESKGRKKRIQVPPSPFVVTKVPSKEAKKEGVKKAKFVAGMTGSKFHSPDCRLIKHKKETKSFSTKQQAKKEGFVPCGICKP